MVTITQNSLTLPVHHQQMKFEMELRGPSPHTQQHHLTHSEDATDGGPLNILFYFIIFLTRR
jgi:hypothetical protein